jgi:Flp pilus assembly protein TadD
MKKILASSSGLEPNSASGAKGRARTILSCFALICVSLLGCCNLGCAQQSKPAQAEYQTLAKDPTRDVALSAKEESEGLKLMDAGKWKEAEGTLKRSLAADVTNGPAHNNLGKVYWHLNQRYLAAWEFDYAAKLMPNQPEPKNNLGLVFEEAGKLDDAVTYYDQAEQLEPDNAQYIGNLARARIRRGDGDTVRPLLERLVMRETRPEWLDWARERLSLMNEPATMPTADSPELNLSK